MFGILRRLCLEPILSFIHSYTQYSVSRMENPYFQNLQEKLHFFICWPIWRWVFSIHRGCCSFVIMLMVFLNCADSQYRKKEIYKAAKRKSCCIAMARRVLPPPAQICSWNNKSDLKNLIFLSHVILKLTLIVLAIVAQDYIVLFF